MIETNKSLQLKLNLSLLKVCSKYLVSLPSFGKQSEGWLNTNNVLEVLIIITHYILFYVSSFCNKFIYYLYFLNYCVNRLNKCIVLLFSETIQRSLWNRRG